MTKDDLLKEQLKNITVQEYGKKPTIEGVQFIPIKHMGTEDGSFEELMRIGDNGELEKLEGFTVKQINRSKIAPNAIKAWHLHLEQDDAWYIPPEDHMLIGLWDLRENSESKDVRMRIVAGEGKSQLIFIPRGVAHGVTNISQKDATIIYFVNQCFNIENPDELRLPWDIIGKEFWEMEKG